MLHKTVGVLLNAFDAKKNIAETIDSICKQTYTDINIIVVCDASADRTLSLLNSINDRRISAVTLDESGLVPTALNKEFKSLNGDYIAFCNAGDIWLPEKLEKQISFLEEHDEYGACFSHVAFKDAKRNAKKESRQFLSTLNIKNMSQSEMLRFFCEYSNRLYHSSFIARKKTIDETGLFNDSLPTLYDHDYTMRILCSAPVYIMEEPLVQILTEQADNPYADQPQKLSATEYMCVVKDAVLHCPNRFFLQTFADRLHFSGDHTDEETYIEKVLFLSKTAAFFSHHSALTVHLLADIVCNDRLRNILQSKFEYTQKDIDYLLQNEIYRDEPTADELVDSLNETISGLQTDISVMQANLMHVEYQYQAILNSRWWKITFPFRMIIISLKTFVRKTPVLNKIAGIVSLLLSKSGRQKLKKRLLLKIMPQNEWKKSAKERAEEEKTVFENNIKFSITVPLYNTPKDFLREMIKSVTEQTYKNWELCLADGSTEDFSFVEKYCKTLAAADKRILYKKLQSNGGISENTNECLKMATGDYIALFDHDDYLHPSALYEYAKVINEQKADFIYCDEDKFTKVGGPFRDAFFKPDFSPDMLRSVNYICHFTVFSKKLLEQVGEFRKEFDGSQDHDLILRLTEKAQCIVHIPKILYHWRISDVSVASDPYAKPYTIEAGKKAIQEHLDRVGLNGTVETVPTLPYYYRVKYAVKDEPLISILIPNNNHIPELSRCIDSIFQKSTYQNFEIIIIENNSNQETFDYYKTIEENPKIKIVNYGSCKEFNYSKINNFGARYASGEHLLLLNNDIEVISPDWLQEMLMFSQRKDVGAVGAMLYYPNDTLQHAGVIIGIGGVAGHAFKYFPRKTGGYFGRAAYAQNYSAVTAACLMLRRSVFDEIGGLNESFKVAFNDIDFCMRIRKAGYLIAWTPFAELYHHESISRGTENTPEKQARFLSETCRFQSIWKEELERGDPYYNPNLTLDREDFSLK